MKVKITLFFFILVFVFGCATKHLTSKVDNENQDTFRDEAFLRFSESRLESLKNTKFKSQALCHEGKTVEGLKVLKKQTKQRKREASFFNEIGMCYFLAENYPKAEYFFNLSLSKARAKVYPPALNNLAVIKLKNRHYQEALSLFSKAAKSTRSSKIISPRFNIAQIYLEFNLADSAMPILRDLNQRGPQDPDILLSLAAAQLLKGQTKAAQTTLRSIPSSFRQRDDVGLAEAIALYESGRYQETKELLEEQQFGRYLPIKRSARKLQKLVEAKIEEIEKAQKATQEAPKKTKRSKRVVASKKKD